MVRTHRTCLIVGAGLAGAKAAETLRAEGFTGRVILIGDERDRPYQRPRLSKDYLLGGRPRADLYVHDPAWYAASDIELHLGQPTVHLDRTAKVVRLGDGTRIHYDTLLLATGAEPRRLDIPGTGLAGVHHLRRLAHAERLRGALATLGRDGGRLVIAGAGWTGLEVAVAARRHGAEVTVVEPEPTPLHRVLGPEVGARLADLHRAHGVTFHLGARPTEIVGRDGMVRAVRTDDGAEHPAQHVLAAIGAAPRTALAEAAGLTLADGPDGGVVVDAALRTSDPDIHAAGDVAAVRAPDTPTPGFAAPPRYAHRAHALDSGPAAARGMLGRPVRHQPLPHITSRQYGLELVYTGYAPPGCYDRVVLRESDTGQGFSAFWLGGGRVLAALDLGGPGAAVPLRRLVRSPHPVDQAALSDPAVPLAAVAEHA